MFQSFFGAGPTVDLEYDFVEQASGKKKFVDVETEKGLQKVQVFTQGDQIKGNLKVKSSKTFDHVGIKLQLIGEIGNICIQSFYFSSLDFHSFLTFF